MFVSIVLFVLATAIAVPGLFMRGGSKKGISPINAAVGMILMLVGVVLFLFGAGLDLTVIGLPAGIGVDALGIILVIGGAGMIGVSPRKKKK
jgi:hypothetical protein